MNNFTAKKYTERFLISLLFIISIILSMFITVPASISTEADAYNASQTLLHKTGSLSSYSNASFKFYVASVSEINLYFTSSTYGYYKMEICDSKGNTVFYDTDYGYSDNYVTLSKGTYTLYLTENDNDYLNYNFYIYRSYNKVIKTTKVTLSKKKLKLNRNMSYTLYSNYYPSTSTQTGKWKTSNKNVVTVSNGYIFAKNFGKATITYKHGNKKAKCKVTVNRDTLEIAKGKAKPLKKWMKKIKGYKKAKWSSSNPYKVSVSRSGTIYAKRGGQATITAKIKGIKYKVKVYAYDKKILKKKTIRDLKDVLYVPSSLKIQTVTYPDFKHCKIYYSAKNLYGTRIYGIRMGYYNYGTFYSYKFV